MSISDEKIDKQNTAFLVGIFQRNEEKTECDELLDELEELMKPWELKSPERKLLEIKNQALAFYLLVEN